MVQYINRSYEEQNPEAYRAVHCEFCSDVRTRRAMGPKAGIRRLHHAVVGPVNPYTFDRTPEESLAHQVVRAIRKKRIQMIFIDEAGTLQVEEIRGLAHVRNVAEAMKWPLTLVLVGMDELPERVTALLQVERRVVHWSYFKPYALDADWWRLLAGLHPHFAGMDARNASDCTEVRFVHEKYKGLLGEMMTFLRRLTLRMRQNPAVPVDIAFLEAVHAELQLSKRQAIFSGELGFRKPLPEDEELLQDPA
jgi:hypothetical protein